MTDGSEQRHRTLVSQLVNSARAVFFTAASAHLLDVDAFSTVALTVLISILANSVLRAAITNPIAVLSTTSSETLAPAIQTQAAVAVALGPAAGLVLFAGGASSTLSIGVALTAGVACFDGARVAAIHLGRAHLAMKLDVLWMGILAAAIAIVWSTDISAAGLLALWSGTALLSLLVSFPAAFVVTPYRIRSFVAAHFPLGRKMSVELLLESVPVRIIPIVMLPLISSGGAGAFRAAETTLGVAVVLWSARGLSTLREAAIAATENPGDQFAAQRVVSNRMGVVAVLLAANWLGVELFGDLIGERVFDSAWSSASHLVLPVSVFVLSQVAMSVPTITARATHRQSEANRAAATAGALALPAGVFGSWLFGIEGLLFGESVAIFLAAEISLRRLSKA